ncbi:unnamed protein product [Ostreobium quekettii]|uniref:Thioredoxin domain-containing protein n=1 Tax=Ostreobium quekettii TaxID=121088 RepID=A0A8S1ITH6_9CHLO|nr:unnamed protein product [Ostreobium quekettii]
MRQHAVDMNGCPGVAGAHRMATPIGLPMLLCPTRSSRSAFLKNARALDCRPSPHTAPRSQSRTVPMAVAATERAVEPDKRHYQSSGEVSVGNGSTPPVHVEWYNKNKELWCEARSSEELQAIITEEEEKFILADFYAGWCSSCKAAYPALCKVAANPDFTKNFKFVKADVQTRDIAQYIRTQGVRGIPTIIVFAPGGAKVAHFGASFRKMNMVKANLIVIASNKGAEFVTDPDGYVLPRPGSN